MKSVRSRVEQLRSRLEWGPRRVLAWYMVELLKRVCGVHLCRLWVGQGPDDAWAADLPEEIPREYPTRCLEPRELIPYVRPDNGLSEEFLLRAQEKGDQCVATFHGGEVVKIGRAHV